MKLRILGNSIRLRLSETDIENVMADMHHSDSTDFGNQKLIYALQGSDVEEISASFNGGFITVDVPKQDLINWAQGEHIGIENEVLLPSGGKLLILIEKDVDKRARRK